MHKIVLNNLLPKVFEHNQPISKVWLNQVRFEKGCNYLIESESGKGKSSLFGYLYGCRHDFFGNIFFENKNIDSIDQNEWDNIRNSSLSFVFQDLRLFPELSALENVYIKNDITKAKSHKEIIQMFETLELKDKIDQKCEKLSWGQQQRVAIVRALCQKFDFLLLDEPISHLDERLAAVVAELVAQQARVHNSAVIVSSIGKRLPLEYNAVFQL